MNVLFINPPIRTKLPPYTYPVGICYVASFLREHGHQVKIIDINGYRLTKNEFTKTLERETFDVIGLGGLITTFNHNKWISQYIKTHYPDVLIFAGNTVASTIPRILLTNTKVDIVVDGEGEETCLDLINTLEQGRPLDRVNGIIYKNIEGKIVENPRRDPIRDLDSLPFPAWDLIPMEIYLENNTKLTGIRSALISTIRGCPYNCRFCCKTFIGYKVRSRSPKNVIEELIKLIKDYKIEGFLPGDDLFIYDKARVMKFCDLLIKENLHYLKWSSSARANLLTKELVEKMKTAGCIRIDFGFESHSQKVLDYYNKKITVQDQQRAINICKEAGMPFFASYIVGARNEDEDSLRECDEFCRKNGYQYYPSNLLMPLPGTAIYEECVQRGIIKDELAYIIKLSKGGDADILIVNCTEKFCDDELVKIFKKYRTLPIIERIRYHLGFVKRFQQDVFDYGLKYSLQNSIKTAIALTRGSQIEIEDRNRWS